MFISVLLPKGYTWVMGNSDLTWTWDPVLLQNILILQIRVRKASDQYIK